MFTFSTTQLSMTEIWSAAYELYKASVSKVWYLALIMMLVMTSGNVFFPVHVPASQVANVSSSMLPELHLSFGSVLFHIIVFFIAWFFMAVIIHRIYKIALSQPQSLQESIQSVLSKYSIILSTMLAAYIPIGLGFALFVVPGLFLLILLMFNLPLVLFEDAGWFEAIRKSWQLVWGNWWTTFFTFIIPGLIIAIITLFVTAIFGLNKPIVMWIVTAIIMSVLKPYLDAVYLIIYNNLKMPIQK